jgi:hypothetical protein
MAYTCTHSKQKQRTRIITRKEAGSRFVTNEHHEIKEIAHNRLYAKIGPSLEIHLAFVQPSKPTMDERRMAHTVWGWS